MDYSRQRGSRKFVYMMPFFLIIFSGIFLICLIDVSYMYFLKDETIRNREVVFYSTKDAIVLPWGASKYSHVSSGAIILDSDVLKTEKESSSMLMFYGKNFVRMKPSSEIVFNTYEENEKIKSVSLSLKEGEYWIDWRNIKDIGIKIEAGNFILESENALLNVFVEGAQVKVDVYDGVSDLKVVEKLDERIRLLDQEVLDADFSAEINQKAINLLKEAKSVDFIYPLKDADKNDSWYLWNIKQSQNPTEFLKINEGKIKNSLTVVPEKKSENVEISKNEEMILEIYSPKNNAEISENSFVLNGMITPDADYIEIFSSNSNGKEYYKLSKFKLGDQEFVYKADKNFGNFAKGNNVYTIVATSLKRREVIIARLEVFSK